MNILNNSRARFSINLLLILFSALVLNIFLNYKDYTLYENANWKSAKIGLRGLFGSNAMVYTKTALSENHLNLGAWFGFQELLYKNPIQAETICFKYKNATPFSFILNQTDSNKCGLFFHFKDDSACCLFVADKEGKFLFKKVFYLNLGNNLWRWNNVIITHRNDSLNVRVNDQVCLSTSFKVPERTHIGFRGGFAPVLVDDVVAYEADAEKCMSENFAPRLKWNWWSLVFILCSVIAIFFLDKLFSSTTAASFNLSLFIGVVASYWFYFYHSSDKYQLDRYDINWHGAKTTIETDSQVLAVIRKEHPIEQVAGKKPVVIFVGTSQTWGAGVSKISLTYPALVEKNLREYFRDSTLTVINTGISGATSEVLYKYYVREWYKYKPLLTVMDLSTNDIDTIVFKKYLQKFMALNEANQIKTLLIAEPNSYTIPRLLANHCIIKEEGKKFGVKAIEMQSFMDSCYESGFLWWDAFHCTDYGYHSFADRISPEIEALIERDSLLIKFNADFKRK